MACGLVLVAPCIAAAQNVTLRGIVFDSLHSRPLGAALVAMGNRSTTSDSSGIFAFYGVEPGTYRLTAQHEVIDKLGFAAVGAQVRVAHDDYFVQIAIPSFATLWRLSCTTTPPARDTGLVFGTGRAVGGNRGITVSASWIDIILAGTKVSQRLRRLEVDADVFGNFALCGVPLNTGFSIQAMASDSSVSGTFDLPPLDMERVIRRDLQIVNRQMEPTAAVTGRVFADSSLGAVAEAEMTLINAGVATRSNGRGEYSFANLRPGSYRLRVRKIGFADVEVTVDVEPGERRVQDLLLLRMAVLDSVAVIGTYLARDEQMRLFEEHRKLGFGKFLTATELVKARGRQLSSLVRQWPGIYIPAGRLDHEPVSKRGIKSILGGGGCRIAVYLDGVRLSIPFDQVPPETLTGVEYFPGPSSTPVEYIHLNDHSGGIMLHSRYK
jgi:hypothetical protein